MPEIAEAGYDTLWVPNPCKGTSGGYSTGYDPFDPFNLGRTNQQGTIATTYGTQAELIQMVQTAHRFGIRIYFDDVPNHRSSTMPGYPGSNTPTDFYPGLIGGLRLPIPQNRPLADQAKRLAFFQQRGFYQERMRRVDRFGGFYRCDIFGQQDFFKRLGIKRVFDITDSVPRINHQQPANVKIRRHRVRSCPGSVTFEPSLFRKI